MDPLLSAAAFLLLLQPSCAGYFWHQGSHQSSSRNLPPLIAKPEFEDTEKDVVASVGSTAFLPCRVNNLGDRMVSWIRTKDLHILTAGVHTFTSDVRFSPASRSHGSANWGLQLRNAQPSDAGTYECQVSTEPKINRKITLEIDESLRDSPHSLTRNALEEAAREIASTGPVTKILGPAEQLVHVGSTITLTCLVIPVDNKLVAVDWLKDNRQVSFQASRGGISVVTDRSDKKTTSSLTVADVTGDDTGNYTCRPHRSPMHSVQLHVIQEEVSGAMRRSRNFSARTSPEIYTHLIMVILLVINYFPLQM